MQRGISGLKAYEGKIRRDKVREEKRRGGEGRGEEGREEEKKREEKSVIICILLLGLKSETNMQFF
jgi:hypothetical protein